MSGKIEYVVSINDTGVSSKTNSIKTGITGVGTAATQAASKTQSLGTSLGTVATKGGQASGVMSKLKGSFAGTAAGMAGLGLGIAGVASQIVGMADAYDNLKDTELKLATQRTAVEKAGNRVTGMEMKLAKMRKDGKSSAADIALMERNIATAKDTLKNKTNNLANAEDDYQRAQRAFYLQIGPQILGIMAQMGSSIMIMKSASAGAGVGMEGMSKGAKVLSLALKAIPLVAIAGAILAIRNNTFGFRDALESVGSKIGQILPGLKPFLDWVHDMAAALGLTGGGVDFGKAFELLKTGFTSAIDTIMNTDWTKVLGEMMDKISNWFNNADWKVLWKYFQDAVISSVDWINKNFGKVWDNIVKWFNAQKWDKIWIAFQNAVFASVDWININFKKIFTAIETWFKAQKWDVIWKAFQDAFISSVTWVKEKLGAVYTAIVLWAKTVNWDAVWATLVNAFVASTTSIAGKLDTWGANIIKELGAAIVKSVSTLGGILSGDSKFLGGLQQAFTDAGKDVDWVSVGNALLYDFFLDIGKWEFKTFHKTIAASFQKTFETMATLIEWKNTAVKFITGLVGAVGTQLATSLGEIQSVGLAFIDSLGKTFTVANFKAGAKKFLDAFVAAVKALPGLLTDLGTWIWDQIAGGAGFIGQKIQEAIKSLKQTASAGKPGTGMPVSTATTNVDNTYAKAAMDELYKYWIRIGGDIQGIIPALKVNTKPATDLMDALLAVWKTKATTMSATLAILKVDTKSATALMDALVAVWRSKAQTITANVPKITVSNTGAFQIIDAVVKRWQSAVSTIQGMVPKITVNNSQALAAINQVVNAQGKIKNIVQIIKGNNSDALNKINQVVNAQGKIKNITQTITTVYRTVGTKAHNITGIRAHNITGAGGGGGDMGIAPLIGGSEMTAGGGGGGTGTGDINITINMRDEFGIEKVRKFKAAMGGNRFVFGSVGTGG